MVRGRVEANERTEPHVRLLTVHDPKSREGPHEVVEDEELFVAEPNVFDERRIAEGRIGAAFAVAVRGGRLALARSPMSMAVVSSRCGTDCTARFQTLDARVRARRDRGRFPSLARLDPGPRERSSCRRVALDRPTDRPTDRPSDRPTDRVSFILVRVYAFARLFVSLDNLCLQYELLDESRSHH